MAPPDAFERAVARTIELETSGRADGAPHDDPADPGGATRWGIAQRSHPGVNVLALSRAEAVEIYRRQYWRPLKLDRVAAPEVACKLFDVSVNVGRRPAVKIAQRAVSWLRRSDGLLPLKADGRLGPLTVAALNRETDRRGPAELLAELRYEQRAYYRRIVSRRPASGRFARGWSRRADAV